MNIHDYPLVVRPLTDEEGGGWLDGGVSVAGGCCTSVFVSTLTALTTAPAFLSTARYFLADSVSRFFLMTIGLPEKRAAVLAASALKSFATLFLTSSNEAPSTIFP